MLKLLAAGLFLFAGSAFAGTCTVTGPDGYSGPVDGLTATCGGTVTQPPQPPIVQPPVTGCDQNQRSTPWNLSRQCAGAITYQYGAPVSSFYLNPLQNLDDVLVGTWLNYQGMSWAWYTQIATGSYISLAFTPTRTDVALNFNANPTYGGGGVISVSTQPGVFDSRAVCVAANGGGNNISIAGYNCTVIAGQTYYLNIASVTPSGTPSCWGIKPWNPQTCSASTISYTAN
jgi:hypothetical protein